jgi:integrase
MLPEHFDAIYDACKVAIYPKRVNAVERRQYTPAEWWHAIMVLGVMTGMRLEEMLALYWINVDLDKGQITIDAINNKGRREANIPLHEAVILHLEPLRQFSEKVFDWQARKRDAKNRTALYRQWHKIQQAADIDICRQRHSHKDSDPCHFYGFHSLKMACGTQNATEMPQMALNAFMRHASPATTARFYRNATRAARKAMGSLFVPDSVKQQRG